MRYDSKIKSQTILIAYMTIVLLFSGCEKTWYDEYIIVNDTNSNVTIYAYDTETDTEVANETFIINAYSEYKILKGRGFHGDYPGVFKDPVIDSVIINFDNEKIIIQSCEFSHGISCEFNRNIMNYLNEKDFVKTEIGNSSGYRYTYTLSGEDYNNAVLIEAK